MTPEGDGSLKRRVADTVKWNIVDRVATQVLYAVTGIILARLLTQEDFGRVGAVMVFQAFALLFTDSGFSAALLQRKAPTQRDYSTVLWFNLGISILIYLLLWMAAPAISRLFGVGDDLVWLARVMFLSFVLNAASIVQANRLLKRLDVRMVAVSNSAGLIAGAVIGIWGAYAGWGAWAIVAQSLMLGAVKALVLWLAGGWQPSFTFSLSVLRSYMRVGMGVMGAQVLNVIFQNIYSFFIGARAGMASLGYYTQADKWSKMGVASLSQVLTQAFLPALSGLQDDAERFRAAIAKMNRLTAYLLFPALGMLAACATPLFHTLFGEKWDASIPIFRLLLLRGVFSVLGAVYNHYVLSLGRSAMMVWMEVLRDVAAIVAILITLPYIAMTQGADIVWGLRIFITGQVTASALTWVVTLVWTVRTLPGATVAGFMMHYAPYILLTVVVTAAMYAVGLVALAPWATLLLQLVVGGVLYLGINALLGSKIQADVVAYVRGRTSL